MAKHAGDFCELNLDDNPRSSIAPDSASLYTSSSTARQASILAYKWICRPDEDAYPFTEDLALHEAVCQWAPPPPDTGRHLPVTRYWAFFEFFGMVIARVRGLLVVSFPQT